MQRLKVLLIAAALLLPLAMMPKAQAQVSFGVTIGGPPPTCPYGYYDYAPYACAPMGYYGPGYFYNGIFLGVGPWAYWGYRHGWGGYRFRGPGGGRYWPHGGYHRYGNYRHNDPRYHGYRGDHGRDRGGDRGYRGGHGGDRGGHGGDRGGRDGGRR